MTIHGSGTPGPLKCFIYVLSLRQTLIKCKTENCIITGILTNKCISIDKVISITDRSLPFFLFLLINDGILPTGNNQFWMYRKDRRVMGLLYVFDVDGMTPGSYVTLVWINLRSDRQIFDYNTQVNCWILMDTFIK